MAYGGATYLSSNPIRRFAHNARFALAAKLVAEGCAPGSNVLDYGAGDGHFLDVLEGRGFRAIGYDPLPIIRREDVVSSLNAITPRSFDCITCLETLEHIDDAQIEQFFADAELLLKPRGVVVISVPVMIGPVVPLKTIPAVLRGNSRQYGYTWGGMLRAAIGKPPARVKGPEGIYYHIGFDHRLLRSKISRRFAVREVTSPFPWLPDILNSQVFFTCSLPQAI